MRCGPWAKGLKSEGRDCRSDFIKTATMTQELTVPMTRPEYELLQLNLEQIDNIKENVTFDSTSDDSPRPKCIVTGTADKVKEVENILKKKLASMKQHQYSIHTKNISEFLRSREWKLLLLGLEKTYKTHIITSNLDNGERAAMPKNNKPEETVSMKEFPSLRTINGCTITIKFGDLCNEQADVIVNSVAKDLNLQTGTISKLMSNAAGPELQTECYRIAPSGMSPGDLVRTSGGKLNCIYVFHGCCERWTGDGTDARDKLKKFINKCLQEVQNRKIGSIAIPCMGTGPYCNIPLETASALLVECVVSFLDKQNDCTLKKVNFVIHNSDFIGHWAFRRALSDIQVEVPVTQSTNSVSEDLADSGQPYSDHEHTTPEGLVISMKIGQLEDEKVDVIVSFAGDLNSADDPIFKSLVDAGGPIFKDECKTLSPGPTPGDIAVTKGGQLHCANVYHGRCYNWNDKKQLAEEMLQRFIKACLQETEQYNHTTMSMPLIGTYEYNFPMDRASLLFLTTMTSYSKQNPSSSLKEINIVIRNTDIDAMQALESELSNYNGNVSSDENLGIRSTAEFKFATQNGIKLYIEEGELANCQADVLVNSIDQTGRLDRGNISETLLKVAGYMLQDECDQAAPNGIKAGDLVETPGGKLLCNHVYHGTCQKWDDNHTESLQLLSRFIGKCLKAAHNNGQTSMAIPAMGTGAYHNIPADRVAQLMMKEIQKFCNTNKRTPLNRITFVMHPKGNAKQAFENELSKHANGNRVWNFATLRQQIPPADIVLGPSPMQIDTKVRNRPNPHLLPTFERLKRTESTDCKETMVFTLLSFSDQDMANVKQEIFDICRNNTRCITIDLTEEQDYISQLTSSHKAEIRKAAEMDKVDIVKNDGRQIKIRGVSRNLSIVRTKIRGVITKAASDEFAKILIEHVQWQYGSNGRFTSYPIVTNAKIEKAYKSKKETVEWQEDDVVKVSINFKKMEERNGTSTRTVRRHHTADKFALPSTWIEQKSDGVFASIEITPLTEEYKKAINLFNKDTESKYTIVQVQRIQNPYLYQRFRVHEKYMQCKHVTRRQLFHGTKKETISSINANGFNRSYAGNNTGHREGKGVYFAVNASYSAKECFSRPDREGLKHIYACSVLTGDYVKGLRNMIDTPVKDQNNPDVLYDSTVDNVEHPSMFVIFKDTQAYPDYLLTFRRNPTPT